MEINKVKADSKLTIAPKGRIDTITSQEFAAAIEFDGIDELLFDLSSVDYISSAGLRVLLSAQKKMARKVMQITGAQPAVKEVFDITGFSDIFTFV